MEWVMGTVEEALSNVCKSDFIFVVFIDGRDELSDRLLGLFMDDAICQRITENNIKVFRIYHGTEAFGSFIAKYKTVPIPSIFVIDRYGEPIDLITSDISSTQAMTHKFDRLINQNRPISHLIPTHFGLSTERAFVTEISSSSSSSPSESDDENQTVIENYASQEQYLTVPSKRVEMQEVVQSYLAAGQDIPDDSPQVSAVSFSKIQREYKMKNSKANHPPLANLIFRFESGDSRSQYFSYKTPFSTVRDYIKQVLKRESDISDFYLSTTFPSRVLVPELDNASLEDLGLYPSAMVNVHFTETDRIRNVVFSKRKTLLERVGGLGTVACLALWTVLNPIMVGTNWLGLGEFLFAEDDGDEYGGFLSNILSFQEMIHD